MILKIVEYCRNAGLAIQKNPNKMIRTATTTIYWVPIALTIGFSVKAFPFFTLFAIILTLLFP